MTFYLTVLGRQRSRPHGIRRERDLAKWKRTPLYIHVEKDFQSHHMQIYSATLMEHCMLTGAGVRYRSGREVKLEIPASFFPTAGQQGLVMLTFA